MYKGARWLGTRILKMGTGQIVKQGDVVEDMPEQEAKDRRGFEPVYEGSSHKKKERKISITAYEVEDEKVQ